MRRIASVLFLAGVVTGTNAGQLVAQTSRANFREMALTGIGYNGALPDAELGAGIFRFIGRGIGMFASAHKTSGSLQNDQNYCPEALGECEVQWVESERNDTRLREDDEWLVINAGAMYALTPELALMFGGGAARATHYVQFVDPEADPALRITPTGNFFVNDEANSKWKPQVVAGALFRAGRSLAFSGGYETALKSASIGVYLMF